MIVDLKSITEGHRDFEFDLAPEWLGRDTDTDQIQAVESPVRVRIRIEKSGDRYILGGRISCSLRSGCDRCLESFLWDLDTDFRVFLALTESLSEEEEMELEDEDLEVFYIENGEIDLHELVREQVYLAIPMRLLCSEGCMGLCPECGVNLNKGRCGCSSVKGHPAFQKLKQLKLEGA